MTGPVAYLNQYVGFKVFLNEKQEVVIAICGRENLNNCSMDLANLNGSENDLDTGFRPALRHLYFRQYFNENFAAEIGSLEAYGQTPLDFHGRAGTITGVRVLGKGFQNDSLSFRVTAGDIGEDDFQADIFDRELGRTYVEAKVIKDVNDRLTISISYENFDGLNIFRQRTDFHLPVAGRNIQVFEESLSDVDDGATKYLVGASVDLGEVFTKQANGLRFTTYHTDTTGDTSDPNSKFNQRIRGITPPEHVSPLVDSAFYVGVFYEKQIFRNSKHNHYLFAYYDQIFDYGEGTGFDQNPLSQSGSRGEFAIGYRMNFNARYNRAKRSFEFTESDNSAPLW